MSAELLFSHIHVVADIAHRIDIGYQYVSYFDKDMTKFPQEHHHVFDEVAHPRPASCCLRELGSYVVGSIDSLASAERAFDFVPVSDGLGHLCEDIRTRRVLRGTTQRLAVGLDFHLFEQLPVCIVHVDLVCENGCRKITESFFEFVDMK